MLEARYRVNDLVNYPESPAKDYVDRSDNFPQPTYLISSIPTWTKSQINIWLRIRSNKLEVKFK
ncbi:hypothetical protein ACMUMS_03920 [Acinetobacter courvalinii]|uniref:hypothetical protein n=1 Tax=Acinetobacter courvalinii TaxID=280147 RepID=UPI003A88B610